MFFFFLRVGGLFGGLDQEQSNSRRTRTIISHCKPYTLLAPHTSKHTSTTTSFFIGFCELCTHESFGYCRERLQEFVRFLCWCIFESIARYTVLYIVYIYALTHTHASALYYLLYSYTSCPPINPILYRQTQHTHTHDTRRTCICTRNVCT